VFKLINVEQYSKKGFQLNSEAEQIVENGSHEALIYNAVPAEGISQNELMVIILMKRFSS
jgi:phenylalanyl-tRNA synthetase alpha chain